MVSCLARNRVGRAVGVLLVTIALLLATGAAPAAAQGDKRVLKVMTYNMDAGTDFLYFLAYWPDVGAAYAATLAELQNSGFEARAAALARKIQAEKPDLVALEEVAVWDYVRDDGTRMALLADQLALLKAALHKHKLAYTVVTQQPLSGLGLPLAPNYNFHYLDRNVVLARADVMPDELAISNVVTQPFSTVTEPLPGIVQVNGWISLDARVRGRHVRFFATHLVSNDPAAQIAQGAELVQAMNRSPYPVVLAGDFNSDASGLGAGPDLTPTAANIAAAGYADAWASVQQPWEGLTWPLFWEDVYAGVFPDGVPVERIDLIFSKGLGVQKAKVVGTDLPYPSDHAGVVAWLELNK
jgi:endonuclease/exonuclease/phosphatase family metal-dependent hydrolase